MLTKLINLFNKYWKLLIFIILLLFIGYYKIENKIVNDKNNELLLKVKVLNAISDSVKYYKSKENEWVAEKLTMQGSIDFLQEYSKKMNDSQKELIKRVEEINKSNTVIAAALIEQKVKIDSLNVIANKNSIDSLDHSISFKDTTKNLNFDITVKNVRPSSMLFLPELSINNLLLPNKQFIEFHWDNDKKLNYPISFTVRNTNDYFKTFDINSYAIPQLDKNKIDPTFWGRTKNFFKETKNDLIFGGTGIAIGILIIKFL